MSSKRKRAVMTTYLVSVHMVEKKPQAAQLTVDVTINQKKVQFEIDTRAVVSLINESTIRKNWKKKEAPGFRQPKIQLKT